MDMMHLLQLVHCHFHLSHDCENALSIPVETILTIFELDFKEKKKQKKKSLKDCEKKIGTYLSLTTN